LYFHHGALEDTPNKIEMLYGMLAAWGMHRMGGGSMVKPFNEFSQKVKQV